MILNEFARGCEYTDLAFEAAYGAAPSSGGADRRLFVCSTAGTVAQVNYDTRELECVFRLHDGPVRAIAVNEGFCVTGSDDKFLRVWPLDFSEFFLEAEHEGPVTAVDISWNGLGILVGTSVGTVGMLDAATHAYQVGGRVGGWVGRWAVGWMGGWPGCRHAQCLPPPTPPHPARRRSSAPTPPASTRLPCALPGPPTRRRPSPGRAWRWPR